LPGRFVIDDFHRLAQHLQEQIADVAKFSAEMGADADLHDCPLGDEVEAATVSLRGEHMAPLA